MKHFWRKPGKTLIYLLSLFLTVGLLGTRVYALDNGETQPTGGNDTQVETDPQETEEETTVGETNALSAVKITPLLQTDAPEDLTDYLDDADHEGDLVVDFYKVASFYDNKFSVEGDDFDLSKYDLNKDFLLKITEGEGGKETDNFEDMIKKWDELAQVLTGQVKTSYESTSAEPIMYNTRKELGETAGESGDLGPGLYLILAHGEGLDGKDQFEEVEVEQTDPKDPKTLLTTIMLTELNTYHFRPVLIVAPSKSDDANQTASTEAPPHMATSDEGKWIYDVNVYLKPQQEPRVGNLRIFKKVETFENRGTKLTPMTAVFKITGWKEHTESEDGKMAPVGDPFYHNVASITVPYAESVLIEGIPAGTYIEVEEIYYGSGYKFLEKNPASVIIKAEPKPEPEPTEEGEEPEAVSFTFKNTYDEELKKGYGVQNSFNNEDGEWKWTNDLPGKTPEPKVEEAR